MNHERLGLGVVGNLMIAVDFEGVMPTGSRQAEILTRAQTISNAIG
jgi:hypothetical protein